MMIFSLVELMDEQKCYDLLVEVLHHEGLHCPNCAQPITMSVVHKRNRAPILQYRCGRVYNLFTGTVWQGTHLCCSKIVRIIQGIAQGVPTRHLALGMDRKHLLERRHQLQQFVAHCSPSGPLPDKIVEVDEMYQNAGEKGLKHEEPDDPPRYRANKRRGHGTWENDRPPILGIVGRETGQIRLEVKKNSQRQTLEPRVLENTSSFSIVNTDEWGAYGHLAEVDRIHTTVCHTPSQREWARDDDSDGIREVHVNTIEGFWTGLRNFLRPFRGINKVYLQQYLAIHEWAHNIKKVSLDFLRILCGLTQFAP